MKFKVGDKVRMKYPFGKRTIGGETTTITKAEKNIYYTDLLPGFGLFDSCFEKVEDKDKITNQYDKSALEQEKIMIARTFESIGYFMIGIGDAVKELEKMYAKSEDLISELENLKEIEVERLDEIRHLKNHNKELIEENKRLEERLLKWKRLAQDFDKF